MMSTYSPCWLRRVSRSLASLAASLGAALFTALAADAPAPAPTGAAAAIPPPPVVTSVPKSSDTYKVRAQDTLLIEVVNEPSISSKEFRVSAGGDISYPYIGTLKVADKTPLAIQMELKGLLEADYLVNAQVIVQIKEYRRRSVSVLGSVTKPGPVEIPPERRLSLIEAISGAGGYTRVARRSDIEVSRANSQKPIRCSDEEQRNSPDKIIYLEDGDVVYVPESRI